MSAEKDYNDEPVLYCKNCLSLKIKNVGDTDYCDNCGSTDIQKCSIEEWETLYKEKNNKTYINYGTGK